MVLLGGRGDDADKSVDVFVKGSALKDAGLDGDDGVGVVGGFSSVRAKRNHKREKQRGAKDLFICHIEPGRSARFEFRWWKEWSDFAWHLRGGRVPGLWRGRRIEIMRRW